MSKKKFRLSPELPLEQELSNKIYTALQGKVVEDILKMSTISDNGSYWRSTLEGHSFKVDEKILGKLYTLFNDIKKKLGFDEPVDFYITGDASVNAFAVSSQEKGKPHIINVNSSLIQLMSDEELTFVIGHELGHLINRHADLLKLIDFIFPEGSAIPIILHYKIRLWQQLSELVADRYGYLAMPDLGVCISAFFKMSSGLDLDKVNIQIDAFIEENNKRLDYFRNDNGMNVATHPINPVRVQALNLYANCKDEEHLQKEMEGLVSILMKIRNTELDVWMAQFIATAGLIVASTDGVFNEDEMETILENLSNFQIFPKNYLEEISNSKDIGKLFTDAVAHIIEIDPTQCELMLKYIMAIVMADKEIKEKEVELIYQLGKDVFGFSPKEIAHYFAEMIQSSYVPSLEVLC